MSTDVREVIETLDTYRCGEDRAVLVRRSEVLRALAAIAVPDTGASLDVERLARAIQSTILTSPDEYMGPGMGAYRERWDALTDRQKRHVIRDAQALAATYARLSEPVEP